MTAAIVNQDKSNSGSFKNDLDNSWRETKRYIVSLWDTNHTAPWAIGSQPELINVARLTLRTRMSPASRYQRIAARLATASKATRAAKVSRQQRTALGRWENEGGKAASAAALKSLR